MLAKKAGDISRQEETNRKAKRWQIQATAHKYNTTKNANLKACHNANTAEILNYDQDSRPLSLLKISKFMPTTAIPSPLLKMNNFTQTMTIKSKKSLSQKRNRRKTFVKIQKKGWLLSRLLWNGSILEV
jgi:hypothetical protein